VCRKKDEYGDTVLATEQGKVDIDFVFSARSLFIFFMLLGLTFCIGPIAKCWRTCCCGPRRPISPLVQENRISVQSTDIVQSPDAEGSEPDSPEDLRKVAQAPMDSLDDVPATPPRELPEGGPLSPSEALSPLTLPPSPVALASPPSESGQSQGSWKRGWQRPTGKRKTPMRESEKAPPPTENETIVTGSRGNEAAEDFARNQAGKNLATTLQQTLM
jgi:hypothetical protein